MRIKLGCKIWGVEVDVGSVAQAKNFGRRKPKSSSASPIHEGCVIFWGIHRSTSSSKAELKLCVSLGLKVSVLLCLNLCSCSFRFQGHLGSLLCQERIKSCMISWPVMPLAAAVVPYIAPNIAGRRRVWSVTHSCCSNSSLNDDATKLVFNDVKDLRTFAQRKKTSDAKLPTWVSLSNMAMFWK